MNIVNGRGNSRTVFIFPDSSFVRRSPVEQQVQAKEMLCKMMGVDPTSTAPDGGTTFEMAA